MLDLETCGTRPGCVVLAIGACSFDGEDTFYEKISVEDSKKFGLVQDPDTMAWWSKQDEAARQEAFSGTTILQTALGKFSDFIQSVTRRKGEVFLWGNGADFDQPILEAIYVAARMKYPIKPYNNRCYRTLKNLYKPIAMKSFQGLKHSALADARNQALHAREILRIHFDKQQD